MARPRLMIEPERVIALARQGMSITDMAEVFGCGRATLHRRYTRQIRKGRALRVLALREAQWRAVVAGNVRMLIWLGKQELGQSNKGPVATREMRTWEMVRGLRRMRV